MDIDEEFGHETVQKQIGHLAQELEETFERVRAFTDSDLAAWFVTQEWRAWGRDEGSAPERTSSGEEQISYGQLRALRAKGVTRLGDLSCDVAEKLIGLLEADERSAGDSGS